MLKKLENYYRRAGILSTDFRCKHSAECRGGLPLTPQGAKNALGTFTPARSAFVGVCYENAHALNLPRIMFVSLDIGSTTYKNSPHYTKDEERTPEAVRLANSAPNSAAMRQPGRHWNHTHKIAITILAAFGVHIEPRECATPFFAHVNSAKCCANREGKEEAPGVMFRNCRGYLRGEIQILSPDVIITQGKQAKDGVEAAFNVSSNWWRDIIVPLGGGKNALWLPGVHSASWGMYNKFKDWDKFAAKAREFFIKERMRD